MIAPSPNPMTPEPRRFSIRLPRPFWIGVAAISVVVFGVLIRFGVVAYRQQIALRGIDQIQRPHSFARARTIRRGPEWFRGWVGEGTMALFDDVQSLDLGYRQDLGSMQITDADVGRLSVLSDLRELRLDGTDVTDAGLEQLRVLKSLESLSLEYTRITDAGLAHLIGLPRLKCLNINHTDVSDAGLIHLARMTNLKTLWLDETRVTRSGAEKLNSELPNGPVQWGVLWSDAPDPFGVLQPP